MASNEAQDPLITCPKCKYPVAVKHHSGGVRVCPEVGVVILNHGVLLKCACRQKRPLSFSSSVAELKRLLQADGVPNHLLEAGMEVIEVAGEGSTYDDDAPAPERLRNLPTGLL
jgi:hypothetical protein